MPLDHEIPAAFNTLDDTATDDGHPLSSFVCREDIHNDRWLLAHVRQSMTCHAWDLSNVFVYRGLYWGRLAWWEGLAWAGARTVTVRCRAVISAGFVARFVVQTRNSGPRTGPDGFASWAAVTGTGAAQDFSLTGRRIEGGAIEGVHVFCMGGLNPSAAADVTGVLTGLPPSGMTSAAAFGAIAEGWAVRLEDAASSRPLTTWHTVINRIDASNLVIRPGWEHWRDVASPQWNSGATQFRGREVAEIRMRSIAIDEDERTGELS